MEIDFTNPYLGVIAICVILIFSYNFNIVAKYTNIPSVLLLILLGVFVKQGLVALSIDTGESLFTILEVVGIVGLIMIVLEAALELELKKEKTSLILKSFFIALIALLATSFLTAYIIYSYIIHNAFLAMIYAIPLSVMSSAIIIPSVAGLVKSKREFLVYESAFSDILGIMVFYFILDNSDIESVGAIIFNVTTNILSTVVLSIVISYLLVILLQRINTQVKLFLLMAVLVLLYSVAKLLHFSSLLIVIVFGLVLNNYKIFFSGNLKTWIKENKLIPVIKDFQLVTIESTFIVRTFFFVIFGMSLELTDLLDMNAALMSLGIVAGILIIRFICFKLFGMKNILLELFIAPRGLITILLFYAIPVSLQSSRFSMGIILYTILISSIIMTIALVIKGKDSERIEILKFDQWEELDEEISTLSKNNHQHRKDLQ
jgi:NhaP-type Na+/H+ or K+/H+ antiporter